MNKDQLLSSPSKISLTIVNICILGIACAIVSVPLLSFVLLRKITKSYV